MYEKQKEGHVQAIRKVNKVSKQGWAGFAPDVGRHKIWVYVTRVKRTNSLDGTNP